MARKPVSELDSDLKYEERATGVPIQVRTPSGFPPPVPDGPEPFHFNLEQAVAQDAIEHPEGYSDFMSRNQKPGKLGTFGDILRSAQRPESRRQGEL